MIIFSHGLAGTITTYSQYCRALASEGYLVLAIEHRDGSGPAVVLPPQNGYKEREVLHYIQHTELSYVSLCCPRSHAEEVLVGQLASTALLLDSGRFSSTCG